MVSVAGRRHVARNTWTQARQAEPLGTVATRWNRAGLEREARLVEAQKRDNGFAHEMQRRAGGKMFRASRQIMDPVPFAAEGGDCPAVTFTGDCATVVRE